MHKKRREVYSRTYMVWFMLEDRPVDPLGPLRFAEQSGGDAQVELGVQVLRIDLYCALEAGRSGTKVGTSGKADA